MWLPVELNNHTEIEKGIREAFLSALQKGKYTYVVKNRDVLNKTISGLKIENAKAILKAFESCSFCYVGTSKLVPCPPFVAFIVSKELGIAYMEHLIDIDDVKVGKIISGFSRNLIELLCFIVFQKNQSINKIIVPFKLKGHEITEYELEQKNDTTIIKRST